MQPTNKFSPLCHLSALEQRPVLGAGIQSSYVPTCCPAGLCLFFHSSHACLKNQQRGGTEGQGPWESLSFLSRCLLDSNSRPYSSRPQSTRTPRSPPQPPACSPSAHFPPPHPFTGCLMGQFGSPMSSSLDTEPGTPTPTQGTWTSMLWLLLRVLSDPHSVCVPHSNHKPPCALDRARDLFARCSVGVGGGMGG